MPIDKSKLLASRDAAVAAKRAFESAYGRDLSNCAVGLGLSRDGRAWTLKVYVPNALVEQHLPERFEKFDVDVEIAGSIVAH